jgi:hypothetical protein
MDVIIALDDYDDIFDDFDIRPYSSRAVSKDFFYEAIRRVKKADGGNLRLVLTVPRKNREKEVEKNIAKRLKMFFSSRLRRIREEKKAGIVKGILMIFISIIAIFISYHFQNNIYVSELAMVAVYFFAWIGLEKIFLEIPRLSKRQAVLERLANARIVFEDEEKVES